MDKKTARIRRARKTRAKIRELRMPRLTVHRTGQHVYAQIIDELGQRVLVAANTLQKDVAEGLSNTSNREAAARVGKVIGERARAAGIEKVAFDRSGFKYHGRIKALADAAREAGLQF